MIRLPPVAEVAQEAASLPDVPEPPDNPLRTLLETFADEIGALARSLADVYDDAFIDTAGEDDAPAGPSRPHRSDDWFDL